MAEICRFFGIIIQMYGNDHIPAHIHVTFNKYKAIIEIETGEILQGSLPSKQLKYVQVWTDIHKEELLENFNNLRAEIQTFKKLKPLQ
ncbi:MAG: hypothetical protein COS14_08915 [Bacteroidetes bacterium CG02_land_8_20_14_3_00_31_25]|nr:DUF4160 domain-containing protein [Bacteroidota bacterium]PIV58574.1 MAG: hypothetical protein COS14_08915 [Bacteroidetes bacterium CG02_land_8_20_14_3_00_31_25]PIY02436.1 MAG: hypothetical protein COZ21_14160 [Bacteroidetes bacterium CG_4_10_14_3_um_filter_31_20]